MARKVVDFIIFYEGEAHAARREVDGTTGVIRLSLSVEHAT
jgi:hypothetical protein